MHDDQHGTAAVVLAALINALKVTGRRLDQVTIVVNGLGAAGTACCQLLLAAGATVSSRVRQKGLGVHRPVRRDCVIPVTNCRTSSGTTTRWERSGKRCEDAHVFIGLSVGNILTPG